jgi:hypothetical protein
VVWLTRYLVVDTGKWLPGEEVMISPIEIVKENWKDKTLHVALTREEIKNRHDIDTDPPVSRQKELERFTSLQLTPFWTTSLILVPPSLLPSLTPSSNKEPMNGEASSGGNLKGTKAKFQLRSTKEVIGYRINARDGTFGNILDFIIHDGTVDQVSAWVIRYIVVDMNDHSPDKKVLLSPMWIDKVSWEEETVDIDLLIESIKRSPRYDPAAPINRVYETQLYDYYGRPKYWEYSPMKK